MSKYSKNCSPECRSFKCGQRALVFKGRRAYCRWADDFCEGPTCNYATCSRGRMLANGMCGLSIRRRTRDDESIDDIERMRVEMTDRVLRKFKGEDLI